VDTEVDKAVVFSIIEEAKVQLQALTM